MDVGAVESPLDVLSRAATMVSAGASSGQGGEHQKQQQHQSSSTTDRGKSTAAAQLYLLVPLSVRTAPRRAEVAPQAEDAANAPLDMRRWQRTVEEPSPPAPSHQRQHQLRPSVITCTPSHSRLPGGMVSVTDDPDIDEHFRRSLGSDYLHLFRALPSSSSQGAADNNNPLPSPKVTGNSVDDHFAKALGDTWQRLQQCQGDGGGGDRKQWQQQCQGEDNGQHATD